MPTYGTTAVNALRWLTGANPISDIDAGFQALAEDVEAKITGDYAEVLTSQTTASTSVIDLATVGPSVTVVPPANALIAVFASVSIDTNTGSAAGARVDLLEDGSDLGQILGVGSAVPAAVRYALAGSTTGSTSRLAGTFFLFAVAAGSHTYKLQYAAVTSGTAAFATRKLYARVFPFV